MAHFMRIFAAVKVSLVNDLLWHHFLNLIIVYLTGLINLMIDVSLFFSVQYQNVKCFHLFLRDIHCVKSVRSRCYSGSYFPAFGLNRDQSYSEDGRFLRSECSYTFQ